MKDLWRGSLATQLRIGSGLLLFVYALLHFLNVGLGLFSNDLMHLAQDARKVVTRSLIGTVLLYGAFAVHIFFALTRLAGRRTLRMPPWEAVQILLGLTIPALLLAHITHTRAANTLYDVNDAMGYIMLLIWGTADGWKQAALLVIVWVHGCLGLHFWLRGKDWWRRSMPLLIAGAVLVPAFALAGFMVAGRRIAVSFANEDMAEMMIQVFNFPDRETFRALITLSDQVLLVFGGILGVVALVLIGRYLMALRRSVEVSYAEGPRITAPKGMTLLEMSRVRNIPHASLCGGRGRCTTCRVIVEEGEEHLHPPSPAEETALRAVGASPRTRLACQIRPQAPLTVYRVFRPDGKRSRHHATQGQERDLAVLFLDMRGFTARTTGQLPYDVVFLLNRFFDAVVPAVTMAGGTVDKYLGDGFLALFEREDAASSARAAIRAVQGIAQELARFNTALASEGGAPVRIGIGVHLGNVVLGEIGAAGQAPRTLIGDTVNTASRLEGVTKEHGVQAFLSAPLLAAAGLSIPEDQMQALELRGLSEPLLALAVAEAQDLEDRLAALAQAAA
ncbi:MAG: adenylate/guanylate cyclase domain-containing protein [Sulfitobacter sp.]|nr:adenylate/guanylate cyclase domain-containing protein [Sulfitobacter sp.]